MKESAHNILVPGHSTICLLLFHRKQYPLSMAVQLSWGAPLVKVCGSSGGDGIFS